MGRKNDLVQYEENQGLSDFLVDLKKLIDNSNMSQDYCERLYHKLQVTYTDWITEEHNEYLMSPDEPIEEDR